MSQFVNTLPNSSFMTAISGLIPTQQISTASRLLRSADCYQQRFIKFPHIGIFHSYAELIHAALLEANQTVLSFVPQPFKLYVGQRRYIPDCYIVRQGKRIVVEIKPHGKLKEDLLVPLTETMKFNGISFEVISNEEILDQEILGINWLHIIRTLVTTEFEDTRLEESELYARLLNKTEQSIGDILSMQNRITHRATEIALFRLVHRGKASMELDDKPLNLETKVTCT